MCVCVVGGEAFFIFTLLIFTYICFVFHVSIISDFIRDVAEVVGHLESRVCLCHRVVIITVRTRMSRLSARPSCFSCEQHSVATIALTQLRRLQIMSLMRCLLSSFSSALEFLSALHD